MSPEEEYYMPLVDSLIIKIECKATWSEVDGSYFCPDFCDFFPDLNTSQYTQPLCHTNIHCINPTHPLNMTVAEAVMDGL